MNRKAACDRLVQKNSPFGMIFTPKMVLMTIVCSKFINFDESGINDMNNIR